MPASKHQPSEETVKPNLPDFLTALGIDDITTHDFTTAWARSSRSSSLQIPVGYRCNGDDLLPELDYLDLASPCVGGDGDHVAIHRPQRSRQVAPAPGDRARTGPRPTVRTGWRSSSPTSMGATFDGLEILDPLRLN